MRRMVVTPTFAAGLGVVVAAVLALHVTGTVFRYSPPDWGHLYPPTGSAAARHQGVHPAAVKPGTPLPTAAPVTAAPSQDPDGAPAPSATATASTGPRPPEFAYTTQHEVPGGFVGQITVSFAGAVPARWVLWFSYPRRHIFSVLGGQWHAENGHAATVTGRGQQWPGESTVRVGFWVSGSPGPPPGCSFNHQACVFS
jgi:hypothetical protein